MIIIYFFYGQTLDDNELFYLRLQIARSSVDAISRDYVPRSAVSLLSFWFIVSSE